MNQVVLLKDLAGLNPGGGGSFKYVEINDKVVIQPKERIKKDYSLGDKSILITTLYLYMTNNGNFQFSIFDRNDLMDRFQLYDTAIVANYTDSIFIPYKDKDSITTNTLHTEITSMTNSVETLNIKILGLELDANG